MTEKQARVRFLDTDVAVRIVLGLDPRAAVASNNLAWVYASRGGQLDQAPPLAQVAKAEVREHAGLADSQTGDRAAARQAVERELELKADFESAEEAWKVLRTLE